MSIGPVSPASVTSFVPPSVSPSGTGGPAATGFSQALDSVSSLSTQADTLATGVATGELTDLHQFTGAAAKAQLGVELTVALRNRAVEAYQEIMRMQV